MELRKLRKSKPIKPSGMNKIGVVFVLQINPNPYQVLSDEQEDSVFRDVLPQGHFLLLLVKVLLFRN